MKNGDMRNALIDAVCGTDVTFLELLKPEAVPTAIHLIPHDGGPCPVEEESFVITQMRVGVMDIEKAFRLRWNHKNAAGDIIAYCPIEIKEVE